MILLLLRRLLRRETLAFTSGTVTTLAVVIAAFVLIAQLSYAALWAPLPNAKADELFELEELHPKRGITDYAVSEPNFLDWQGALPQAKLAAIQAIDLTLNADGGEVAQRIVGMQASAEVFSVLGLSLQGRPWHDGNDDGVVLSASLFRQRFGDTALADQTLLVNGRRRPVIGIAPDSVGVAAQVDAWIVHPLDNTDRDDRRLGVWARVRPGTSAQSLASALATAHAQLAQAYPDANGGWQAKATPALTAIVGESLGQRVLLLLFASAVLVVLATVNLANLLIARGLQRTRDLATRQALGASNQRLLAESTSEAALLAVLGAALGMVAAAVMFPTLHAELPVSTRWQELRFHWPIALVSLLAGMVPMVIGGALAARFALVAARAQGSRQRAPRAPWRSALVLTQLALATCLLSVALILAGEWRRLLAVELGFDTSTVIVARFAIDEVTDGPSHNRGLRTVADLVEAARAVPGIRAAAIASEAPLGEFNTSMMLAAGSLPPDGDQGSQVSWRIVSEGYFNASGTTLLSGRDFGPDESPNSAILSASLARALWPDQSPLGRSLTFENGRSMTVVGVVADVRNNAIDGQPSPTVYLATSWYLWPTMTLVVRAESDAESAQAALLAATQAARPETPLFDLTTLGTRVARHLAPQRQQLMTMQVFGAISVLLACVGIFSVVAHSLAQRRGELALRLAMGATRSRLLRDELRSGLLRSLSGAALGVMLLAMAFPWLKTTLALATPSVAMMGTATLAMVALAVAATLLATRSIRHLAPITHLHANTEVS